MQNFTDVPINVSNCHCNNILTGHKCLAVLLIPQAEGITQKDLKIIAKFVIYNIKRKDWRSLCSVTSACNRRTGQLLETDWCRFTDLLNVFSEVTLMWTLTLNCSTHTLFMYTVQTRATA